MNYRLLIRTAALGVSLALGIWGGASATESHTTTGSDGDKAHQAPQHKDESDAGAVSRKPADESMHSDEKESREVHLDAKQRSTIDIQTTSLMRRSIGESITGPGEVKLNGYATIEVTPRISAQVLSRLARLGENVEAGQPLVTLSSVEMATAQGELLVAEREWQRVRKLGQQVVSERRFIEARVAREQTRARVLAYGMTEDQVGSLLRGGVSQANGAFQLLAIEAGTVVEDEFHLGELVEPGRTLFRITDESVRWVEARFPSRDAGRVRPGHTARIQHQGRWLEGLVTQVRHQLDEVTRTLGVRIEVSDPERTLVPGNFVEVAVLAGESAPVLAVPEEALQRSPDGDWQVFIAESELEFRPLEIKVVRRGAGLVVIDGLPEGTDVVTRGAFFLQSELAKSGFDIHGH